jgi:hypothetical protein
MPISTALLTPDGLSFTIFMRSLTSMIWEELNWGTCLNPCLSKILSHVLGHRLHHLEKAQKRPLESTCRARRSPASDAIVWPRLLCDGDGVMQPDKVLAIPGWRMCRVDKVATRMVTLANIPRKVVSLRPWGLHFGFIGLKCCSRWAESESKGLRWKSFFDFASLP